ncbi:hypothetical protein EDC01DRAFT_632909 [Geopyxis carbonaria]|nr:hypothetical protein EDC01DRAFT_632909 [Geopyxis carbonaria]
MQTSRRIPSLPSAPSAYMLTRTQQIDTRPAELIDAIRAINNYIRFEDCKQRQFLEQLEERKATFYAMENPDLAGDNGGVKSWERKSPAFFTHQLLHTLSTTVDPSKQDVKDAKQRMLIDPTYRDALSKQRRGLHILKVQKEAFYALDSSRPPYDGSSLKPNISEVFDEESYAPKPFQLQKNAKPGQKLQMFPAGWHNTQYPSHDTPEARNAFDNELKRKAATNGISEISLNVPGQRRVMQDLGQSANQSSPDPQQHLSWGFPENYESNWPESQSIGNTNRWEDVDYSQQQSAQEYQQKNMGYPQQQQPVQEYQQRDIEYSPPNHDHAQYQHTDQQYQYLDQHYQYPDQQYPGLQYTDDGGWTEYKNRLDWDN